MKAMNKQSRKIRLSSCQVFALNQQKLQEVEGGFPYGVTEGTSKNFFELLNTTFRKIERPTAS